MHRIAVAALVAACLASAAPVAAQPSRSRTSDAWKKGAVCYEIFVRSFKDSDGDGIGDLNGLIQKLDYINDGNPRTQRDLGARCIWLMPVAESPSYHGYDATDYYKVEKDYGTNADFRRLTREAHKRGVKVFVDLVLNHASSEHPFFKEALADTNSPHRHWFRWSATKPNAKGPWGQEVWHKSPVHDEYYYGIFWSGMPDLNYESPAVRAEAKKVARYWLKDMGVDGFRLDAVPYLIEEGDKLAHTSGTHAELKEFADYVRRVSPGAYTIGEAWTSTDTILTYYPDQLDAYFAFPASDAILDAVRSNNGKRLLPEFVRFQRAVPADRWSPFQRNHDQTRTLTVLGGDVARAKLAAALLLTLPGLPYVYYGEEIGMTGDKPDERLRTPMQWSREPGVGFTTGKAWEALQPDSLTANVAAQDSDPQSLLNLYRRLIHLRATSSALGTGELVPIDASNDAVVAYLRRDARRPVLVVANLGTTPLAGVTIASAAGALPARSYRATELLSGVSAAPLLISADGRVTGYVALPTLAPMQIYLLELAPVR